MCTYYYYYVLTTYLPMSVLLIYRCTYYYYYLFTDARTTHVPIHLLLLCTDVPTTAHRAGRVPEAQPVGQQLEERAAARLPRLGVRS